MTPLTAAAPLPPGVEGEPALLHAFLERAARRWPGQVAIDVPPGPDRPARVTLTYAELDAAADAVAAALRGSVRGEAVVAILLPRNHWDLYAAQLGTLKAGAAYTCLDPSFPDARLAELLADSAAVAVLTNPAGAARLRPIGAGPLALDVQALVASGLKGSGRESLPPPGPAPVPGEASSDSRPDPLPAVRPEQLAYLIYTSGTTGRPKAVMIEHRSVANLVADDLARWGIGPADRVAQNSSVAYDSSVEEIWFALAAGATLVPMDDATVRLGPDLIDWLQRERITVFCPPPTLLRATGCTDPARALPGLRMIFVGGEALPPELAARWARGRTLINDYGPTECTVTCLREAVVPGEPVGIGRPVRGASAWILDAAGAEVPEGEPGELCLGGAGLARGYWQRPELTAERFPVHPRLGRIYRTGDLVRRDATGRHFFLGRIDAQVKLRGYRVELAEIEARLGALPGVRAAGCAVHSPHGVQTLVAGVVATDPRLPPALADLRAALAETLPDYMVPAQLAVLERLPTAVSGKLDRTALAAQVAAAAPAPVTAAREEPDPPLERALRAACTEVLGLPHAVDPAADFFRDLGGDSLTAAQLVTRLREDPETAWVSVRDIYEARTVEALAARVPRAPAPAATPTAPVTPAGANGRAPFARVQATALAAGLISGAAVTYVVFAGVLPAALDGWSPAVLLLLGPPAVLVALTLQGVAAVAFTGWLQRRFRADLAPGRIPLGSAAHARLWLLQRAAHAIPWRLLEGTELQNAALRALGARIGEGVRLHHGADFTRGGWDRLAIGDGVTVGRDAVLELVRLEAGEIVLAGVTLEAGSTLETHTHVSGGARVGANAFLTARSAVAPAATVPAGARWDGVPARPAGQAPPAPELPADGFAPGIHAVLLVLARLALTAALWVPAELAALAAASATGVDAAALSEWLSAPAFSPGILGAAAGLTLLAVPLWLLAGALACRLLGRLPSGVHSCWSGVAIRVSLKVGVVDAASRWLYGTRLWPGWLRLAGMQVGAGCEVSSLIDCVPELTAIGDRTFCADGIYLGGPRLHRGTLTLAPVRLGADSFVGNGAVIPAGVRLPDGILLGVATVGEAAFPAGSSWFGHPPFALPRRVETRFAAGLTHRPSAARRLLRVGWELLRFALPGVAALLLALWLPLVTYVVAVAPPLLAVAVLLPLANATLLLVAPAAAAVALKWLLLGRVQPAAHPLWSGWASRWDFHCVAWNVLAAELAGWLDGTPWLAHLLRAAGARIGRGTLLGGGFGDDLPDPDLVEIGDGAAVDGLFQAHTFEDRVLKMDHVRIAAGATIGRNAMLLYGSEIGAGARVEANSVVMKEERLLPGGSYAGVPTTRV